MIPRSSVSTTTPHATNERTIRCTARVTVLRVPQDSVIRRTIWDSAALPCKDRSRPVVDATSRKNGYPARHMPQWSGRSAILSFVTE